MGIDMSLLPRFIRKTIYSLKRKYGTEVTYFRLNSSNTDYDTGEKIVDTTAYRITKCAALPAKLARELTKNVSMISGNKLFAWGGTYDAAVRVFIIDSYDLPRGFVPEMDDYIVYNGYRYSIKDVTIFEQHAGWIITAKTDVGTPTDRVVSVDTTDDLEISEEAEGES
jgi:hypothetical protein